MSTEHPGLARQLEQRRAQLGARLTPELLGQPGLREPETREVPRRGRLDLAVVNAQREHPAEGYRAGDRNGQQGLPEPPFRRPRDEQDPGADDGHAVGAEELLVQVALLHQPEQAPRGGQDDGDPGLT